MSEEEAVEEEVEREVKEEEKEPIYQVVLSFKPLSKDEKVIKYCIESMIGYLEGEFDLEGRVWITTVRRVQ
jgi:hypothetical protein